MCSVPLRILCVFSSLDRGGAESMCMNFYRNINREKIQFDFVKHSEETGVFEEEIQSLGGQIYCAPRFKIYNYLSYKRWWYNHLENHPEHQIIHGHFFTISSVYFKFAKKHKRKTVGHVHASKSDGIIKSYLCKKIEKKTDYALACSEQSGKWIYPNKEFTVLKNVIDVDAFTFKNKIRIIYRNKLGINDDTLVLGTVANMSSVKNPQGLMDIFVNVKNKNKNTKLLWIGDGGCRTEIEERIKKEHLNDFVLLLGIRTDVAQCIQAMDAFLLPSFNEGLPVSAIEAQAAGIKCFLSDNITREVDISGRCTFLPIDKPEVWVEHILNSDLSKINTEENIVRAGYDVKTTSK